MDIDKETKAIVAERMRDVHYWVGMTLNAAQSLEYGCKFLLFILAEQKLTDFSAQEAKALMDGDQKKTLGQVLKELRKHVQFEAEQEQSFLDALDRRNWFIHEFYIARTDGLVDASGRDAAVRELKSLKRQFVNADAIIRPVIRQLMMKFHQMDIDDFSKEAIDRLITDD